MTASSNLQRECLLLWAKSGAQAVEEGFTTINMTLSKMPFGVNEGRRGLSTTPIFMTEQWNWGAFLVNGITKAWLDNEKGRQGEGGLHVQKENRSKLGLES